LEHGVLDLDELIVVIHLHDLPTENGRTNNEIDLAVVFNGFQEFGKHGESPGEKNKGLVA
jgi:hypothetical protein